jgi:hypothetical protein
MDTNNAMVRRRLLIGGYLGVVLLMLACMGIGVAPSSAEDGALNVEEGVVEVQEEDGGWEAVAGEATFELVGELEDMDPWVVAGVTLQTNDSTQIAEGLQVGDVVRVRGAILEDETWLAYSIEPAGEPIDPIIVLIGKVDSMDPWVVSGITLNVTDSTEIRGTVTVGMIVRVEILLLSDGTWETLSITPLGDFAEVEECATVIATIVAVNGNEIQFLGWPLTVILDVDVQSGNGNGNDNDNDNGNENDNNENDADNDKEIVLTAGQVVLAVVCVSDDGRIVIVRIFILTPEEDNDTGAPPGTEKILICHRPPKRPHTLSVPAPAVPAHLGHGDTLGPCP